MESVYSIVRDVKAHDLCLCQSRDRTGEKQLQIDADAGIMELPYHVGKLFLRAARVAGRAQGRSGGVIKASCVAPVVDPRNAEVTDGMPFYVDRIKGQRVLHGAGAFVGAGLGLQLVDRHQLNSGDAEAL